MLISGSLFSPALLAANLFVGSVPAGQSGSNYTTIQAAIDNVQPGDTIYLRGGNYHEEVLMQDLAGSVGSPIKITNWDNESVRIDGSKNLTDLGSNGWTLMQTGEGHPNCASNCYKTTLNANNDIWQLWADDRMQVVARWPNVTVGHPTDPIRLKDDKITPVDGSWWDQSGTWGHMNNAWNYDSSGETGTVANNTAYHDLSVGLDANVSFTGGSIILNYHSETQFSREITNHSSGSNDITHKGVLNPWDQGSGYFLVEAKTALDIPGEWYYDKDTREVWYWPEDGQDPTGKNIRGKVQSYAFNFSGSSYLTIEGLDFFGTGIISEENHKSDHVTINENTFLYPSMYRRMLKEHNIVINNQGGEVRHGGDSDVGATILIGDNFLISNNEFAYGDGRVDMNGAGKPVNNVVTNNLFHHWSFTGMSGMILMMNANKGTSEQSYNTFHTHGGQVMSKHSYVDVNWSRASYWGYFKQDGVAFQCAGGAITGGGGSDGRVRHHIWAHNALKPAVRWDGTDGINGTDHHVAGANIPGLSLTKGDFHKLYHMSGTLSFDQNNPMLKIVDDNDVNEGQAGFEIRNANTATHNSIADSISAERNGYTPLNGTESNNWNGYLHTAFGDTSDAQMRDPNNLDFRPAPGSELIDAGLVLPGFNDNFVGSAPDIGAYEHNDSNYWIPGYRAKEKANSPIPMNASTTVKSDGDLMFLAARNAVSNKVYFGTAPASLTLLADNVSNVDNIIDPGNMVINTTYFWRVDTVLADSSVVTGDVWNFTTEQPVVLQQNLVTVSEDTYVRSDKATSNYGDAVELAVRTPTDGTAEKIAYLKFDVDVIGTIVSATLRLHRKDGGSSINDVEIYAMSDNSWDAATMTWEDKPVIDGALLATKDIGANTWSNFDVSSAVSNGTISFGIRRSASDTNRDFDAGESAFAPQLEVLYTDGTGDSAPIKPANVTATENLKSVTIHWDTSAEGDIDGYKIYRRQNVEDFFVTPIHPGLITGSSYEDDGLLLGLPHQYVVRAVDLAAQQSPNSLIATITLADNDNDGMSDNWESAYGLNTTVNDTALDLDGDSLSNLTEYNLSLLPNDADTDGDSMNDGFEVTNGLNPEVNDAADDADSDTYSNVVEYAAGTDPQDANSYPAQVSTLFTEGFESGFNHWTTNGTTVTASGAATEGSKGGRLKNTSSITTIIDTSGYNSVTLSYDRRVSDNLESGEYLVIEYSTDGNNWTTIEQTADTNWVSQSFVDVLPVHSSVYLRLSSTANKNNERCDFDKILITAQ